jgi:syntaxin-binding protein 5
MADFSKQEKRSGFIRRGHSSQGPVNPEWPVAIEFGVMTIDGDDYSSILCFVGTNLGRLATFKILPQPSGGYKAQFSGATMLNGRVVAICPIVAESGKPALASGVAVAGLREGRQVNGTLVVGMLPSDL